MSKLTMVQVLSSTALATSGNVNSDAVSLEAYEDVRGNLGLQVKRSGGSGSLGCTVSASINHVDYVTPSIASGVASASTATGDIFPVKINTPVSDLRFNFTATTSNIAGLEAWLVVL